MIPKRRTRKMKSENELENERNVVAIRRVLDAPPELVWAAWTDPAGISNWWGPNGFTTTTEVMDVRPGGVWRHTMHGPDGTDYPNFTEYIEVEPPTRLVYRNSGGNGDLAEVSFVSTVEFRERGGKTELSMRMVFENDAMRELVVRKYGAIEGLENLVTRLNVYLKEVRPRITDSAGRL